MGSLGRALGGDARVVRDLHRAGIDEIAITISVSQAVSVLMSTFDFRAFDRQRIVVREYEFPMVGQIAHAQELRAPRLWSRSSVSAAKTLPALVGSLAGDGIIVSSRDNNLRIARQSYNASADLRAILEALEWHRHLVVGGV